MQKPKLSPRDRTTRKNQHDSPLILLPAELRNNIYSIISGGNYIEVKQLSRSSWVIKDITPPRLTCRQINHEARIFAQNSTTLILWRPMKESDLASLSTWPKSGAAHMPSMDSRMAFMQEIHSALTGLLRVVVWPDNDFDTFETWLPEHLRRQLEMPELEIVFG
ncbi:hypothetical protein ST47_g4487 [Ascochyta rabiei]|uniref:Uncharacterized protein n=1 Tax=Didymella rabiei TaxID=5454 RepID=A0A163FHW2_DIDRA|nr:hypothetical protein ST47_g4487 [Ascochyta rabiei]